MNEPLDPEKIRRRNDYQVKYFLFFSCGNDLGLLNDLGLNFNLPSRDRCLSQTSYLRDIKITGFASVKETLTTPFKFSIKIFGHVTTEDTLAISAKSSKSNALTCPKS